MFSDSLPSTLRATGLLELLVVSLNNWWFNLGFVNRETLLMPELLNAAILILPAAGAGARHHYRGGLFSYDMCSKLQSRLGLLLACFEVFHIHGNKVLLSSWLCLALLQRFPDQGSRSLRSSGSSGRVLWSQGMDHMCLHSQSLPVSAHLYLSTFVASCLSFCLSRSICDRLCTILQILLSSVLSLLMGL